MTDLGFQTSLFYLPSVGLPADQYYTKQDSVRKLSSGSNELLRKSQAC